MSVRYGDAIVAGSMLVDATPTEGSNRPVSSGGVFDVCANRDASNFTDIGKTTLAVFGYPDVTRAESVIPLASGGEYTAPANGWFFTITAATGANCHTYIRYTANMDQLFRFLDWKGSSGGSVNIWCPVKAGETVIINYNAGTLNNVYFIPAYGQQTGGQ